jgi:hypothetical protein
MALNSRTTILGLFKRFRGPAVAFTCALTILIWMKLRLTTGVPRSVYAVPHDSLSPSPRATPEPHDEQKSRANPDADRSAAPGERAPQAQ